jgi:serine/threonine protein kinase
MHFGYPWPTPSLKESYPTVMSETPEPALEILVAELRRLVTPLPSLLEQAPENALDQVRHTAKWVLQQVYQRKSGNPGELRYPQLFEAAQDVIPHRIRIQLQTIQFYGTAEERAHEGPSDISRLEVLPCLQALDNVVQWFLVEHLKTDLALTVLPEPGTKSPPEASTTEVDRRASSQEKTESIVSDIPGSPSQFAPVQQRPGGSPWLLAALALIALAIVGLFLLQIDDLRQYSDRRIGVIMEETAGGILISSVQGMGPADRGGIEAGDLLLYIDGHRIEQFSDFDASTEGFRRDKRAQIRVLRSGRELTFEVEPGLAMNWSQPTAIAFSMSICLLFGILGLYHRPFDLRTRLLSTFLLMVALELSLSLGSLPPGLEIANNLLFFLLTGSEIAITLHLASLIPERQLWLRHRPWLVPLFYLLGLSLTASGMIPTLQEYGLGNLHLPWNSDSANQVLNELMLPLWALALLLILLRPALYYPEIQGRLQARLAFFGLVPWSLGYVLLLSLFRMMDREGPLWLLDSLPFLVLFFPAAIATVILLEARNHRKILLTLTQEIRQLDTLAEMTDLVATDLEAAFHPRGLYVFFQKEQNDELTLGHSTGVPSQVQRIPHHFEIAHRAEDSGRILVFPEDLSDLPEDEQRWLERLGVRLIVPVNDSRRDLVGLILLGEKRSEEGYNRNDLKLLHSLVGQIALSFENLGLQNRLGEKTRIQREVLARLQEREINLARECPVCGRCYDCTVEECPYDGSEVVLAVPVERVISGRYRLEQVLGKGGVGSVYQATDLRLDRQVAVKVLLGSALDNPLAQRRFEREARVVAQLDHPNIVTVHDFGRTEVGNAFIVLELLEGITLRSALRHRGAIDPPTLANWFGQILEGLRAAHRSGVIHRDLKPGNVFITHKVGRDEVVKLLDFGIAKIKSSPSFEPGHLTLPGVILGTVGYMAPEQVLGDEIDERADLYSVGIMVLESLRGHRPFHGRSPVEVLNSLTGAPQKLAFDFNEELAAIIECCLERNPAKRFPSAEDLQVALIPTLKACRPLTKSPDSRGILADLSTSDSTFLEPDVLRGPTEKINLTGQMESYLQGLRSELKSRNKEP